MDEQSLDPEEIARRRKSTLLLIAGACSLALPLAGVGYLRWKEAHGQPRQAASAAVFQPRDGVRRVTLPSAPAVAAGVALATVVQAPPPSASAPTAASPATTGSLGFIKPSADYYKERPAAPAPRKEQAAPAPAPEPARPVAKRARGKPGKKPFVMPKLNPGKGFTNFKRRQPEPEEAEGGDVSGMLQNLPPGAANNPELQKYLQGR